MPNGDIDWSAKGMVTAVKNQGKCQADYAFSAVAACESWALLNNNPVDLSEQQLVDCSKDYNNNGCSGGFPAGSLSYVKARGLVLEKEYPYVAKELLSCQHNKGAFKVGGHQLISGGCPALIDILNSEPVIVSVDAAKWADYKSGVISKCGLLPNHSVLLVGVVGGNWKIKNSWGTGWGESGYVRLAPGSTCSICLKAGVIPV